MLRNLTLSMFDLVSLIIFILPVYFANSIPVLLGGGTRLDLGKNFFDGLPIFGSGKTIRGFIIGIVAGSIIAGMIANIHVLGWFIDSTFQFWGGVALSLGTMIGDAGGSFLKRRLGIESGKQFLPDTFIFLAFALIFVYPYVSVSLYSIENLVFLFGLTIVLHPAANFIANRLGLKRVPW
jgi:CDP-2,3-bis-(O-geranylgeranyl)-sn-glycerol synthase